MEMSTLKDGATYSETFSINEWIAANRPQYTTDARSLGPIECLGLRQTAGSFPDPAGDYWGLNICTDCSMDSKFDLGAGSFEGTTRSGDMVLGTAHNECQYELDADHELVYLTLPASLLTSMLREIDPDFTGDFGRLHSMRFRDNAIRDLGLEIWRAAKGDARAPHLDAGEALLAMGRLLLGRAKSGFTEKELALQLAPHIRRRIVDYVEAHLDEDCALFTLAEVAGLSPYHFARAFRADMGDTPLQYVTRRRLRRAEDLISGTNRPFGDIALETGFSSQQRLNDAFRKHLGMTPGEMRKMARA